MDFKHYTLPENFGLGDSDSLVYFYTNNRSSANNKVVFTKNMICLLLHGVKEVHTAQRSEVITDKELLMLTAGSVLMSETVAEGHRYEAILVFFGNKTLTEFCTRYTVDIKSKPAPKTIFKLTKDVFLNNYCQSLQLLQQHATPVMYELKIQELLGYINTAHPEIFSRLVTQALSSNADVKLQQVVALNSNKGLSIEELAFLCNMSISTFKRHFADVYGVSPQKYFAQLKMAQAKYLLSINKRPSEIYAALGYENLSAFSTEFKKHFGVSPTQYRGANELPAKAIELLK